MVTARILLWKQPLELGSFSEEDSGYALVSRIPPSQKPNTYVIECLEMITVPNLNNSPIDKLFEIEKRSIQDDLPKKVTFQILKKTSKEVIALFFCKRIRAFFKSFCIHQHGSESLVL